MEEIIKTTEQKLNSTVHALHEKLSTIIATGAHPAMLKNIEVNYYETMTPISQLANIKAQDATMLMVTPFDKTINKDILDAIHKANIGLSPVDEGESIRIMVPPMTAEKRTIFAKDAKNIGEESRISVRNIRTEANKKIKNLDASENEERLAEEKIQDLINKTNKEIESVIKAKVDSLMNI